jgi:hypothetical protein
MTEVAGVLGGEGVSPRCPKCNVEMQEGKVLQEIMSGLPDFIGDTHCCTVSPSGKANLVGCLKCPECGHSVR